MTGNTTATSNLKGNDLAHLSDAELVEHAQLGSEAFGEIVRRHQAVVFGSAFRVVRDPVLAEDIAQEAFLRAFKSLTDYRGEGDLRGWLYRIARNLALNAVTRRRETPSAELPEITDGSTPESEALRAADIRDVRNALARVPEPLRVPLVMREYHGMTYEEIADRTGVPLNTVRTRIFRAKRALETILGGTR